MRPTDLRLIMDTLSRECGGYIINKLIYLSNIKLADCLLITLASLWEEKDVEAKVLITYTKIDGRLRPQAIDVYRLRDNKMIMSLYVK